MLQRMIPLAAVLQVLTSCATPAHEGATATATTTTTPSFDVMVAAVPSACCPTCERIELSIRNTSDAPVAIDWPRTRMEHNGAAVDLVVDAPPSTIAPHDTWKGTLRPKPGAPHATSLEEGKLRNGRYSFHVAVQNGEALTTSSTEVRISYGEGSTNPACPP